uniref:Uncharacterized protein n=1 Tax=Arundo donax TaxID=35708 RepID=A0A0A9AB02_ARUDO
MPNLTVTNLHPNVKRASNSSEIKQHARE